MSHHLVAILGPWLTRLLRPLRPRQSRRTSLASPRRDDAWAGLERLEDRVLYSVSPIGGDAVAPPSGLDGIAAIDAEREPWTDATASDGVISRAAEANVRRELVIVDAGTPDHEQLIDDLRARSRDGLELEVIVLDADRDGVEQITEVLGRSRGLDAVHIISHGQNAGVQLGNGWLDSESLAGYADQIAGWSDGLNADADLLIYGCDLASATSGTSFVEAMATLTGADVAASDDRTGIATLGGDWELEYATGAIETEVAVSDGLQQTWHAVLDETNPLWMSTKNSVGGGGQPGDDTWDKGDLVKMTGPGLQYGPGGTGGSFSEAFDIDLFAAGAKTNAVHYVTNGITIGGSGFQLQRGDILLSMEDTKTLTSTSVASDPGFTNNLTASKADVFVFRPDTPGDYSSGTFAMLLEDPSGNGKDVRAITLVEQDTTVGDADLSAGDFLFTYADGAVAQDILLFQTTDVGAGNTSGAVSVLLDGSDAGVAIGKDIFGLDLVERTTTVGGHTLQTGTLLLSLKDSTTVGSNGLAATKFDIISLDVSTTTLVAGAGNGSATAAIFFRGSDVAFDSGDEVLDAFTLTVGNNVPVVTPTGPNGSYTENEGPKVVDGGLSVDDVDHAFLQGATVSITSGYRSGEDILGFVDQLGITGHWDAVTGVLTLSGTASVADYEAALQSVTYENTSEDPSTVQREITFQVDDGDAVGDGVRAIDITSVNDTPTTTGIGNVNVDEDAGNTVVDLFGAFDDIEDLDGQLVYSIEGNTNAGLFSSFTIDAATGTLTLDYAADAFGTAQITIRAMDSEGAYVETVLTVVVDPENDAPILTTQPGAKVQQGSTVVITKEMLNVTDIDNTSGQIIYTITAAPGAGMVRLDGEVLGVGQAFTQADINAGRVTYELHASGEGFQFVVTDGSGGELAASEFEIEVVAPIVPPTLIPPPLLPIPKSPLVLTSETGPEAVETAVPESESATANIDPVYLAYLMRRHDEGQPASRRDAAGPEQFELADVERRATEARRAGTQSDVERILQMESEEVVETASEAITMAGRRAIEFVSKVGGSLWDELDEMSAGIQVSGSTPVAVAGSATFVFAGLSAGYVVAVIRGGYLASSLLSSMPAWRMVDPLPILDSLAGTDADQEDDESLASMIDRQRPGADDD
ncbi:MAG: DUF4347 domain-containing protein [Phycisphaerae bacterium]|nr:DUF4347 domain-containing protein [Phycisphaerae bacterium]